MVITSIGICFGQIGSDSLKLLDYDIDQNEQNISNENLPKYADEISNWTSANQVHDWIEDNFSYDFNRAVLLSNNRKLESQTSIFKPEELWVEKRGMCVDLSRFAVEITKAIDSTAYVKYLKIEFEPIEIDGSKFVNHWIAALKENDEFYFFADSKRPKVKAGPYTSVEDFILSYEKFRERKIVSYKLLDSYKKTKRTKMYRETIKKGTDR